MLTGTLEELSSHRRSKKIGDGAETKETELDVLQRQRNKGAKRLRKWSERNRARRAAQTASERQATSQQRSTRERERMAAETPEERERRLQRMNSNQHERLAVETPEKIIADENQPARKFGS